ncbi:MAG: altronate dehydratase family protein [Desulfobacterales bacterium]|jgi:altronate hydrolase
MTRQHGKTIKLSPEDNVMVALSELAPDSIIDKAAICSSERIPAGHKMAASQINSGSPIIKYGQTIGFASKNILPGNHVHTHNTVVSSFTRDYAIGADAQPTPLRSEKDQATFEGIVRPNGQVATRNYIGILATVSCSTSVAHFIANAVEKDSSAQYAQVDGILALGHGSGCCDAEGGEGLELLQRALAGYAGNPNFGGILLVGLGCEVNHLDCLLENMQLEEGPLMKTVNIQNAAGTAETVRCGVEAVEAMLPEVNRAKRSPVSASHIVLGLECGGSDGYSGISANPALGKAVDILIANGGTAILSETPEIYGAEHLLTRRAVSEKVGQKLIDRIRWWQDYTARHDAAINNNPSPGNKAGGLTTILEKSLGAVAKGGSTNLIDVYGYAEAVKSKGLVFMDTPGYDVVSVTGMIAGGANLICFTTGRGSVCGFKPVPTLKLASNSEMYARMHDDMDVNCGLIIDGKAGIEEMGETIFRLILETASGKKSKSETFGFGANEFVPWHIGAVM